MFRDIDPLLQDERLFAGFFLDRNSVNEGSGPVASRLQLPCIAVLLTFPSCGLCNPAGTLVGNGRTPNVDGVMLAA
ncbi:MAG: hypothetical protein CMJ57_12105 [Planctomycetaceae bacterium]|nr:hypothetical protein [Planctomycetaceae bacterium]